MDLVFLFKCTMGLYDLDLSYYLVSADNSNYNLTHSYHQFKITYARTNGKSWNPLPLHLRKTQSLNAFKDHLKSLLHLKDISTFSEFIFLTPLIIFLV